MDRIISYTMQLCPILSRCDINDTFTRTSRDSIGVLGLNDLSTTTDWVDEKSPPVKVSYDNINQRLNFNVDRNVLGTGTDSNFNSFAIYGASTATATNNLGVPTLDDTTEVQIKGGEFFAGEAFVADKRMADAQWSATIVDKNNQKHLLIINI